MSRTHISAALREQVRIRAANRCQYCLTSEPITGMPMEIDHIEPEANGGATTEDNLCLACTACNEYKGDRVSAKDPDTGLYAPIYHPLQQSWHEHFAWSEDGTESVFCSEGNHGMPFGPVRRRSRLETIPLPNLLTCFADTPPGPISSLRWFLIMLRYDSSRRLF